jgi:hypothetical protein
MTPRSAAVLAVWTGTLVGAAIMVLVIATVIASLGGPGLAIVITILAGDAVTFGTVGMLIARQRPYKRIS